MSDTLTAAVGALWAALDEGEADALGPLRDALADLGVPPGRHPAGPDQGGNYGWSENALPLAWFDALTGWAWQEPRWKCYQTRLAAYLALAESEKSVRGEAPQRKAGGEGGTHT